jgi:hypothetical protein
MEAVGEEVGEADRDGGGVSVGVGVGCCEDCSALDLFPWSVHSLQNTIPPPMEKLTRRPSSSPPYSPPHSPQSSRQQQARQPVPISKSSAASSPISWHAPSWHRTLLAPLARSSAHASLPSAVQRSMCAAHLDISAARPSMPLVLRERPRGARWCRMRLRVRGPYSQLVVYNKSNDRSTNSSRVGASVVSIDHLSLSAPWTPSYTALRRLRCDPSGVTAPPAQTKPLSPAISLEAFLALTQAL